MITKRQALTAAPTALLVASALARHATAQTVQGEPKLNDLPPEVKAIIETVFKAFNSKDVALLKSVYAGDLVLVDGFAPYRWTGPNAVGDWWDDADGWAKRGGVEKEELVYKSLLASGVAGARGYASTSATL